ncbi:helix-turn-helix domain-containing protein [Spartinivicinus poritis]|uniref:Helix-turn-helix domain-containing protein n=1 Tax=Spartinivicinus poritis TaxID=2994640 RepID=A0ABT5U5Y9_9GAMM|nr:helix-turn-helix domain-containing protein [Spartinivicinus sp. A2-2]MDE1461401.1 helix-turn-helix domain-containing protein [Spartinivicinus sp. A2-2]
MTKIDGRKLSHEELEKIRVAAVKRVHAGESPELVIKSIGFHRSCIYDWLSQYKMHGEEGLKAKPITGRPPKLTEEHLKQLILLLEKKPTEFGIEKVLWDRDSFKQIIEQEFHVKISKTGVSRLLAKLGIYSKESYDFSANEYLSEKIALLKLDAKKSKEVLYFVTNQQVVLDNASDMSAVCFCAVTAKGDLRFIITNKDKAGFINDTFTEILTATVQKPVKLVRLEELEKDSFAANRSSSTTDIVNTPLYSASQTSFV